MVLLSKVFLFWNIIRYIRINFNRVPISTWRCTKIPTYIWVGISVTRYVHSYKKQDESLKPAYPWDILVTGSKVWIKTKRKTLKIYSKQKTKQNWFYKMKISKQIRTHLNTRVRNCRVIKIPRYKSKSTKHAVTVEKLKLQEKETQKKYMSN